MDERAINVLLNDAEADQEIADAILYSKRDGMPARSISELHNEGRRAFIILAGVQIKRLFDKSIRKILKEYIESVFNIFALTFREESRA